MVLTAARIERGGRAGNPAAKTGGGVGAAFVGGSGGVRLGASGPGGSTRWDLAALGDGTARPERHQKRRFAASSAPAGLGEAAALGCMRSQRVGMAAQGVRLGLRRGSQGSRAGFWRGGSPGISAGDHGGALRTRGGCGRREKGPTGGVPAQRDGASATLAGGTGVNGRGERVRRGAG